MKKNFIMASVIALIFVGLYSCSPDEKSVDLASPNTEMNSMFAKLEDSPVLFTYKTDEECQKAIAEAISKLAEDTDEELKNSVDVDQIANRVRIDDGKGVLTEIHYLNTANNKIVRSLILNPNTGGYDTINVGVSFNDAPDVPTGPCPQGWNHLGDCTVGSSTYGTCIAAATANYQTSHLGKTNIYTYTTPPGTSTTTMCALSVKPS